MGGQVGRILRGVVRGLYVVLAVYLLLTVAIATGIVTVDSQQITTVQTPEPLPDVPFVLEFPLDREPPARPADPNETTLNGSLNPSVVAQAIHKQTNQLRARHDRSHIGYDQTIEAIGRRHSYDMANRGYFNHTSPDGAGPSDRFGDLFPRRCRAVGENLALMTTPDDPTARQLARRITWGWMNSSGHRQNLLAARWDVEGVGVYITGDRVYASQEFCNEW